MFRELGSRAAFGSVRLLGQFNRQVGETAGQRGVPLVRKAPLIGLLSNGHFGLSVDKVTTSNRELVAARRRGVTCGCGCGSQVADGRKFLNQQHYDRSKGLRPEMAEQVLVRLRAGESAKKLARELGVAHTTIYRLMRKSRMTRGY
jgi:hypothetical protein